MATTKKNEEVKATQTAVRKPALTVEERRKINNKKYMDYMNEKVPVCIPLGSEKIGTTTTASCDGKVYEIKLGETVKVPRKVAEVINRSIKGNMEVQKKMENAANGAKEIGEY